MSHRALEHKRHRRVRREILAGRHEGSIDLIEWVKARSRVTTGTATRIILAGALRVDSHTIGVEEIDGKKILKRYVPAKLRGQIQIVVPEEFRDGAR